MAPFVRWDCICVLMLLVDVCLLDGVTSLDVVGKPANQSSTAPYGIEAGKAVDGDLSTFSHTAYTTAAQKTDPWWRLDLEAVYCLRTITIYNRDGSCGHSLLCAHRLEGAVVRAGLNPDRVSSRVIAIVTNGQASDGNVPIVITADPVVTARYVRVDLPGTNKILHMREVKVEEHSDEEVGGEVDFTLVTNPALLGQTGDDDATIAAYKGPDDISADVSFGRQVTTGGSDNLPSGSMQDPKEGCQVIGKLNLPEEGGKDRTGVFYCEASRAGRTDTRIQTVILPKDGSTVHTRPVQQTLTTNVGDSVRMQMQTVAAPNTNYRWKHNSKVIQPWNGQLSVSIDDVAMSDGGVYSCFVLGQEDQQLHAIMRLIVRGCSSGRWGSPACLNVCRRCYNGGVCHATTGSCICAPGFSGDHCEQVHGRNAFGQNATHSCSNTADPHDDACRGRLFCLPDPYGCSCAAGFMGLDCMQECDEGKYGADCEQMCHCASVGEGTCRKDTGECTNDACDSSYSGNNCQCSKTEPFPGEVKSNSIMQRNLSFSWSEPKCGGLPGLPITGYQYKLTNRSSGTPTLVVNSTTTQTSVLLDELIPYVVYGFQVAAEGIGTYSESVVVRTNEAEPTVPLNVTIQNVSEDSITAGWMQPDPPQGIITAYEIAWTSEDGTQEPQDVGNVLVYTIKGLRLNLTYQVQVRARTKIGPGPLSEVIHVTVVGVPGPLQNLRSTNRTQETVTLDWDPPLNPKGPISGYVVQYGTTKQPDSFIEKETADTPFLQGNLKPSTEYEFIVSARNLWHVGEPQHLKVSTESRKASQASTGLVVGMVFLVLALIIIIVGVIVVYKRRASPAPDECEGRGSLMLSPDQLPEQKSDDLQFASNAYDDSEAECGPTTIVEPTTPEEPTTAEEPTIPVPQRSPLKPFKNPAPVRMEKLAEYIKTKELAREKGFEADYKTLPDGPLHPWTVAKKPENRQKNRFANVIAYDHSRIVLTRLEGDPHSDYINACYIDGYKETDKYIASQGPNQASLNDIWRMVWQMNVDKIVMLTNPVENGKAKCLQYWPSTGTSTYSGINVTISDERMFLDHTIRLFKIMPIDNEDESRLVKQFHYTTWPDMKPPEYPAPLLNFMRVVNAEHNLGRTLIHCSAGVGRTGTYICLDSMLEQMKEEGQVNVLGFIYQMRQKRIKMVQTQEQYKFIFDALLAASQTGETTYDLTCFRRQLTALKKKESGSKKTGVEKQFKTLGELRLSGRSSRSRSAQLPENVAKNRYPDFIPTDRSRPFLMIKSSEDDGDYINASFIPGYDKKDRYISTQMPLPNTAADIWRLVYDQKATCIVMLNPMDEKDRTMCRYWPEEGPMEFGPLVVKPLQTTQYKGVFGRTLSLRNTAKSEPVRTVCMFQIQDWPSDQEVPSSRQGILTLMDLTQKWHEEKPPIVVHCLNGFGRSAVYCTLMSVMEKFQEEKVVDVFQAVLRLRAVNGSMMYSMDHFAMCYDVFLAYLDSSTVYENL